MASANCAITPVCLELTVPLLQYALS